MSHFAIQILNTWSPKKGKKQIKGVMLMLSLTYGNKMLKEPLQMKNNEYIFNTIVEIRRKKLNKKYN